MADYFHPPHMTGDLAISAADALAAGESYIDTVAANVGSIFAVLGLVLGMSFFYWLMRKVFRA